VVAKELLRVDLMLEIIIDGLGEIDLVRDVELRSVDRERLEALVVQVGRGEVRRGADHETDVVAVPEKEVSLIRRTDDDSPREHVEPVVLRRLHARGDVEFLRLNVLEQLQITVHALGLDLSTVRSLCRFRRES
jgi:hypothetical protein